MSSNKPKKPARQYTELIEERGVLAARNKELEAAAASFAARVQTAVDEAVAATRARHDADWARAAEDRAVLLAQLSQLRRQLDQSSELLERASAERDLARHDQAAAEARADDLDARLRELGPQVELLAQQRAELSHICDAVRARMRRREREEEQAILNRRQLSRAAPRRNLG